MKIVFLSLMVVMVSMLAARADSFPAPERLPVSKELPDPLVMFDGARVSTPTDWVMKRRPELQRLFQHYMYGELPRAVKVKAAVEHEDPRAFGGKATLYEIALTLAPAPAPKVRVLLVVPNRRKGQVPVFVGMNFEGNHALVDDPKVRLPDTWMYPRQGVKGNTATESRRGKAKDVWALEQSIDRGYAVATFYNGDLDPDRKEVRGGLRPFLDPKEKASTIGFWAWGIHRVIDYLVTRPDIDTKKIAVVGHSRLGKTALVAGAFDERIALTIPHQAGCGGTAPSRNPPKTAESVKRINTSFPHWFNAAFKGFNDNTERLPFDQHCLAALVAPRPLLYTNAENDLWANPAGQFEMLRAAEPVYKLLGAGGLASPKMPALGKLSDGKLGFWMRAGKHSTTPEDWATFLDFADRHLGKPTGSAPASAKRKLLLIGQGPDGHPPQTHEYMSGLEVLAGCLKNVGEIEVTLVKADGKWPEGPELIDRADGVVLFLAEGAKWVSADPARRAAFQRLAKRGGGRVALHWAMGSRTAEPVTEFVRLFGGCHGGPDRKYKVLQTKVKVASQGHPIATGLRDFDIKDEFYYQLKFPRSAPAAVVKATIDGEDHTVAWASEAGQGRAFGFSGLHFHENWKRAEYRRLVAQGVLWSLGISIPEGGLDVTLPKKQTGRSAR